MNKKILLGSIIAVVILVLVSFTGVVGYQTTKSSTVAKASPLFSIRSKRAIDGESKDLICDYVGKGEESILSIPKRDSKTALIQKVIDRISRMDDKTFNRLIELVFISLHQENTINFETKSEIVALLGQLRNEPMKPANYRLFQKTDSGNRLATEFSGCDTTCITACCGPFEKLVMLLLFMIAIITNGIYAIFTVFLDCLE